MSQYKDLVNKQKARLDAEQWAKSIKCLEAKDGYLEREYNSGLVEREYQDGSYEVIKRAKPLDEIIENFMRRTI
jgi:hypothetical protein